MKKKIVLKYKKDNRLNNAVLTLDKKMLDFLKITDENNLIFTYENNNIFLENGFLEKEIEEKKNGNTIFLKKNIKIQKNKAKNYITNKILIPLIILNTFGVNEENTEIFIEFEKNNKIKISKITKNDRVVDFSNKGEKVGTIITVKVNKGGVGKTFITTQLGSYLALEGKKVLLLTSDSQNNILDYCFGLKEVTFINGLKEFVKGKEGEIIKLRNNLDFIPLENSSFGSQFLMNLPIFLEEMKKKYDFILIDSIPTMKIDSVFVHCSDKIIVPCFGDTVTIRGAINVINEAGADKILAVLVNKYENKNIQNILLKEITEAIKGTDILFPQPIKNISEIETLLHKGKTIWESNSKKLQEIKESFKVVGDSLINNKIAKRENFDIDFDI